MVRLWRAAARIFCGGVSVLDERIQGAHFMSGPVILATDENLQVLRTPAKRRPTLERLELSDCPLEFFVVGQRIIVAPLPVEIRTIEG